MQKGLKMNKGKKVEYIIFGIILMIVGGLFLVNNFYPKLEIWSNLVKLWPIILIIYGIKKMYMAFSEGKNSNEI